MACAAETAARHRHVTRALRHVEGVVAVDTIDPREDPSGAWTTEVVIEGDGVRWDVLEPIAACRCTLVTAQQRGAPVHTVVVLR